MLASDLARLYEVPTKALNLAVKRNGHRFPKDISFVLPDKETAALRYQIETSKHGRGGRRYPERVFTEHGVAMLSSVLNSERAVRLNIEIIRTFVRLRHILLSNRELARRVDRVEVKLGEQEQMLGRHAEELTSVFEELRRLLNEPSGPRKRIGFSR